MNEHVDKLAEQCRSYWKSAGDMTYPQFDHRKFAQLIIQECAGLTLDHRSPDYYQGWLDYRDEIRQHWGIEK